MNVSILICTYGGDEWRDLAMSRAYPSTIDQGALEVNTHHFWGDSLADSRNWAAEDAKGDWLCFLDADDELCPGYIAEMAKVERRRLYHDSLTLEQTEVALLAPAVSYDGSTPGIPNRGGWPSVNECVIGTLVPRALFLELGGFRELPSLEDYDLWLRCAKAGARIVHVPEAVYCAHVTPGSRNTDQSVYAQLRLEHAEVWAR